MRSYLPDGRGVVWVAPEMPGIARAIDAEPAAAEVSRRLARRAGTEDPTVVWPLWTRAETVAKLLDLPVLSWLAWPGLEVPADLACRVALCTVLLPDDVTGDVTVSCGATVAT
ncbi:hypothetical protein [Allobranchiibius sp. GilTou38]|uniref:hypothetical protein n=1 Tax=Allobranchiibius sp. GilTou38 TaxID=2815210 RepID=UPI001AA16A32|nr:hypothetical protein [Allobranchiibius sp. GilTou38]MBO1765698.1 hypothetical protein [Allobranchiibius sp. GilTou38]